MLELLSLRTGTTLTKENVPQPSLRRDGRARTEVIDVFICKLRKKLSSACGGDNYIETVWGRGYVLREPGPKGRSGLERNPSWGLQPLRGLAPGRFLFAGHCFGLNAGGAIGLRLSANGRRAFALRVADRSP